MTILLRKYGQVTRVFLDDKLIYESGCTVKAEAKHLRALLEAMTLTNVEVVEA